MIVDVGELVRVKRGRTDPDFPDIPIGGWAGTVQNIYKGAPPNYLIRWNQRTLDSLHPVYKNRCEVKQPGRNQQLIRDYRYWLWNWR